VCHGTRKAEPEASPKAGTVLTTDGATPAFHRNLAEVKPQPGFSGAITFTLGEEREETWGVSVLWESWTFIVHKTGQEVIVAGNPQRYGRIRGAMPKRVLDQISEYTQ